MDLEIVENIAKEEIEALYDEVLDRADLTAGGYCSCSYQYCYEIKLVCDNGAAYCSDRGVSVSYVGFWSFCDGPVNGNPHTQCTSGRARCTANQYAWIYFSGGAWCDCR